MASSTSTGASPVKERLELSVVDQEDDGGRVGIRRGCRAVRVQNVNLDAVQHHGHISPRFEPCDTLVSGRLQYPQSGVLSRRLRGVHHVRHIDRLDDGFGPTDVIQIRMGNTRASIRLTPLRRE